MGSGNSKFLECHVHVTPRSDQKPKKIEFETAINLYNGNFTINAL